MIVSDIRVDKNGTRDATSNNSIRRAVSQQLSKICSTMGFRCDSLCELSYTGDRKRMLPTYDAVPSSSTSLDSTGGLSSAMGISTLSFAAFLIGVEAISPLKGD